MNKILFTLYYSGSSRVHFAAAIDPIMLFSKIKQTFPSLFLRAQFRASERADLCVWKDRNFGIGKNTNKHESFRKTALTVVSGARVK